METNSQSPKQEMPSALERFVTLCFHQRLIVWAVLLLSTCYGWYCWTQLPVEAYPDIADVTSKVVTQVPGLAAEEVEQQITIPLERALIGTPGMHVMRSRSTFGLSQITVVFQDGVEDYWSRQRLLERFAGVSLPYGAQPSLDPLTSPVGEIYRYTLESKTHSLRELSELQFWTVFPRIKMVPGIVDVANFGGLRTQYMLVLEPSKMVEFGVTLKQITGAINSNNSNAGGCMLEHGEQAFVVRGVGLIQNLQDLGNVVVTARNGVPIQIKRLGQLTLSHQERRGVFGKNGNPDCIEGIVLLLKGHNPSRALEGLHEAVRDLNQNLLPEGVKVVPFLDRTALINATMETVGKTLTEGIILVVLVLLLFLGSVRAALITAVTIPLSLLLAFTVMHHFEIPANLLSLGSIDFGILVDGTVCVIENMLRQREANPTKEFGPQAAIESTIELVRPVFFGMLVILVAFFPLFAFQHIEYKLFSPMAYTVSAALAGALLLTLALVPGLAYLAYHKPRPAHRNFVLRLLTERYEAYLRAVVGLRLPVLLATGVALSTLLWLSVKIGRDFLPYLDEGSIWMQVTLPPGLSLNKASQVASRIREATLSFPEVSFVVTQVGRDDEGTDAWSPSHIESAIGLHPYKTWTSGKNKQQLITDISGRLQHVQGARVSFSQPIIDMVLDNVAGAHSELVVKVYGEDFKVLRKLAEDVAKTLKAIPGSADVIIDQPPPLSEARITVDRDAAARHGINVEDISDLIDTGIGGKPIGTLFVGERRYNLAVRLSQPVRQSIEAFRRLQLTSPTGAYIPLSEVATLNVENGESTVTREMGRRLLTVGINVRGTDLSTFLARARHEVAQLKYDRQHYHLSWGGQLDNLERAQARLALILPMTLGLMFTLLFAAFRNVRQSLLILGAVPLAALGGMAALHLRGMTLNVSSSVGFIALFGVAVLNGLLMIAQINGVRRTSGGPLKDCIVQAARDRMRPVLMTATVAALGLLPAAISTGLGSDVQRPLATVVVGGLITATALTLLLLPAFYYLLEGGRPETTHDEQ